VFATIPGPRPIRTAFLGSGSFAVPILDALVDLADVAVVAVVSAPDRPAGRGRDLVSVPVVQRARELGLTLLQPSRIRSADAVEAIRELGPDVGVLADYGQLVPQAVLDVPRHGILNLHPSLLPRHRGATPVPATILAGDRVAGVTLMLMDAGLDTGPVVASVSWPLAGDETGPTLEAEAARHGATLLRRSIGAWIDGALEARPQAADGVSLTRPLRREDGRLDPHRSALELERQVRAYQPWPGSFLETAGGRLVVWRAAMGLAGEEDGPAAVGLLVADRDGIALVTADGRLRLVEVQPAGGRRMSAAEFRRGRSGTVGERVR
jgi:methionyl-tRNA formyltransferase